MRPWPPTRGGAGMTNQMLAEQGSYGYGDGCGSSGSYGSAMNRFDQAACGPTATDSNGNFCTPRQRLRLVCLTFTIGVGPQRWPSRVDELR